MTPIIVSQGDEKPRELPEPDVHNAVCVWVADLGKHPESFPGKPIKVAHKIQVGWEIEQAMTDGRRFHVSKEYTLSLWETATLYKHLVRWRGKEFTEAELKGFDIETLVGKPCRLSLVKTKSGKSVKVDQVLPVKRGWEPFTPEVTDKPDWVETKTATYAAELTAFMRGEPPHEEIDEELPAKQAGFDEIPF